MNVYAICDDNGKLVSKFYSKLSTAKGQLTQTRRLRAYVPTRIYIDGKYVKNPNYEADLKAKMARFDRWSIVTYELIEMNRIFGSEIAYEC